MCLSPRAPPAAPRHAPGADGARLRPADRPLEGAHSREGTAMDDAASPVAATPTSDRPLGRVRVLGLVVVIAGCIMSVAGLLTWFLVQDQLSDENITVSDDADNFAGDPVEGPFTAYAEADAIEGHALEASGGKTYAELAQDDPTRDTVMTASFLRSSLFTSVVAFGVAAMAFALGLVLVVIGLALVSLAAPPATPGGHPRRLDRSAPVAEGSSSGDR